MQIYLSCIHLELYFFWSMNYVGLSWEMAEGLSRLLNQVCCRDPQWDGRSTWHIHAQSRALQRPIVSDLGAGWPGWRWLGDSAVWHSRSLSGSSWAGPQPSQVSALLLLAKGNSCSSHCWQQHACPHEDAAGWPDLSFGLCSPEKSLDNLISGCPWMLVTDKACPVVNVLHILPPYLKIRVDLHLYVAWTTKVLIFCFQSCKC